MCHRSWSFPTFQLRFLCIVLIFRQMARLPGPALELYPTPASEFLRRECLFLKSANQTWRLSFNGMACGIAYSWSNACGWEDRWSRPPESHMRSWKQWVQSALYHLGRDGSAQRGCDIRVFGGERNDAEPNASRSNLTETIFSLSRHLPVLLTVSGPMIVLPPQSRASEPSSSLSPFPPLSISSLIFPDWTSVMLFPLHPFHFRFR